MTTTLFDAALGHPDQQANILAAVRQERLPHAFLFTGPEGCGKEAFAIGVAALLNAAGPTLDGDPQAEKIRHLQHPDVQFVMPTPARSNVKDEELQAALREKAANPYRRTAFGGKNTFIGIDTIRELKRESSFSLYEGKRKVFILSEAERMRVEAANALLKLLEEPPPNLVLILVSAGLHRILPTIKSRCQILRFARLPEADLVRILSRHLPREAPDRIAVVARLSGFNLKRAFDFLDQDVLALRDAAIDFLRKVVLINRPHELMQIVEPLTAKRDLADARLVLWFLTLWFQDILHLRSAGDGETPLYNADQRETLRKFLNFTANADIAAMVDDLAAARGALDDPRNLNPQLVMTTLALTLHRRLKR